MSGDRPKIPHSRSPHRAPRDAADFEVLCAEWMSWFGLARVSTTNPGADGGVDVIGDGVIAQAKFHLNHKTKISEVRDLIGCKEIHKAREAWFFNYLGYTADVIKLGEAGHVELFKFNADNLQFIGLTAKAHALCTGSLNLATQRQAIRLTNGKWVRVGDKIGLASGAAGFVTQIIGETIHLQFHDGSVRRIPKASLS